MAMARQHTVGLVQKQAHDEMEREKQKRRDAARQITGVLSCSPSASCAGRFALCSLPGRSASASSTARRASSRGTRARRTFSSAPSGAASCT
eukprot:5699467-Prymnesium_polylepis.1